MDIALLPGERWWGGCVDDGWRMPFPSGHRRRLLDQLANQVQPLLVSNRGRSVWSEDPYAFTLHDDRLVIDEALGRVVVDEGRGDLKGACLAAARRWFAPSGALPDPLLFTHPQYNTWIELTYDQAEEPILRYAEALLRAGYPPGVFMIDDNWQDAYGTWEFHPGRFRDPRSMIRRLHDLGFKVMLWTCPFVSPDTRTYRALRDQGLLLRDTAGVPAIRQWWNGHSAVLDMTNPAACAWLGGKLDGLVSEYGVDGFKLDAGDFAYYRADDQATVPGHPGTHSEAWARFGLRWPLNEYRACWKLGGQALAQRLRDKLHNWEADNGLAGCIPNVLAQGLVGYPFTCPDMIGGGEYLDFHRNSDRLDHELFVRHAQLAALLPMMQFSAAPWRVLPPAMDALCLAAARLHVEHGGYILDLARHAAVSGEPIVRPLAWEDPSGGHDQVVDQFLLGERILVAPVQQRGQRRRSVRFPAGRWLGDDATLVEGPTVREVDAPLGRLPHWLRQ
ncbi:MAG: alpha-galactosidase [Planctomycetes bacterium]|nr:alpha-galactosidase [Planctomycetota bacterium]